MPKETQTCDGSLDEQPPSSLCATARGDVGDESTLPTWAAAGDAAAWNDWRWQMRNRLRSPADVTRRFPEFRVALGMAEACGRFPMAITPYYASLIERWDNSDPVYRMSVPQVQELVDPAYLGDDPLGEDHDMPVPGLVHRYRDRALLITTTTCGSYCRHCTRKRVAGQRETAISQRRLRQVVEYLRGHEEIRDVIVSGGDPLTLSTEVLERVLAALRSVPSVDVIRLGTRTPVVLPMRITEELTAMLRRYHPLYINTHFNHPVELTPAAADACGRLAGAGIPLGNQTVLLRGVNDDAVVLEHLFRGLVRARVRPYYLFQCDLVRGVEHFRTPLTRGLEIMEYLRGRLSGLAIPTFVVDAPQGGGKIPLLPNYVVSMSPSHTVLRNYQGVLVSYPEPVGDDGRTATLPTGIEGGVWALASGLAGKISAPETTPVPTGQGKG